MAGQHALLAPSGFKALMLCPAKPAMERGLPDTSSTYADEGTAAHELAAMALRAGTDCAGYVGRVITVEGSDFVVDTDMADAVQIYVDLVRDLVANGGTLLVEQSLPISHITGEDGAEGTGDAVIIRDDEIFVVDLKYGRGVEVDAEMNPQLMLYGLGALEKFDMLGEFQRVCMLISQPRVSRAPSEFTLPVPSLIEWGLKYAGPAATLAMDLYQRGQHDVSEHCRPHEDACRFCRAKPTCPALSRSVEEALGAEFTDLTTEDKVEQEQIVKRLTSAAAPDRLGTKMAAVELVEMWCKAIRGRVESELLAGRSVEGYKLVAGKKGARSWTSEAEAEAALKAMRLKKDEMYAFKLISPTTAEKLLKGTPKRWARVAPFITQTDGKPSVAPVSDKRPPLEIKPIESEFAPIGATVEDLV